MNDTFRKRLKRLRLEAGKTQDDMAKLINVKRTTYGEYERGNIIPPVEKIEQIAEALGVEPHYLIGWDTSEASANTARGGLADMLRQLREEKKRSVMQAMTDTGIPTATLLQYETGGRKIPYTALKKLAAYFGVDLELLYGIEFGAGEDEAEEIREAMQRLKLAEDWSQEFGKVIFTDEEHQELINFAKYLLYKRNM